VFRGRRFVASVSWQAFRIRITKTGGSELSGASKLQ
jgi:hypothetical protein